MAAPIDFFSAPVSSEVHRCALRAAFQAYLARGDRNYYWTVRQMADSLNTCDNFRDLCEHEGKARFKLVRNMGMLAERISAVMMCDSDWARLCGIPELLPGDGRDPSMVQQCSERCVGCHNPLYEMENCQDIVAIEHAYMTPSQMLCPPVHRDPNMIMRGASLRVHASCAPVCAFCNCHVLRELGNPRSDLDRAIFPAPASVWRQPTPTRNEYVCFRCFHAPGESVTFVEAALAAEMLVERPEKPGFYAIAPAWSPRGFFGSEKNPLPQIAVKDDKPAPSLKRAKPTSNGARKQHTGPSC